MKAFAIHFFLKIRKFFKFIFKLRNFCLVAKFLSQILLSLFQSFLFLDQLKITPNSSSLFCHWSAMTSLVISLWIRAIICIIDSSPCLNRSDNRLDMINPVILLALCCKSLTFAVSGGFTMFVGVSTVFCLETPESLFFDVFEAILGLAVM